LCIIVCVDCCTVINIIIIATETVLFIKGLCEAPLLLKSSYKTIYDNHSFPEIALALFVTWHWEVVDSYDFCFDMFTSLPPTTWPKEFNLSTSKLTLRLTVRLAA